MEDFEIELKKAMTGDSVAFHKICLIKSKSVIYLCIKNMGNVPDGEDAAQEVFIRMQNGIRTLKDEKAFDGWLYKIIQNTCNNLRRKNMKNSGNLPIEDYEDLILDNNLDFLPEEVVENEEKRKNLLGVIDKMPHNMKMCVVLFYYEGLQQAEIAEILDLSIDSVKSNIKRAKVKIRAEVNVLEPEYSDSKFAMPVVMLGALFEEDASSLVTGSVVDVCLKSTATAVAAGAGIAAASTGGTGALAGIVTAVVSVLVAGACVTATLVSAGNPVSSNLDFVSISESAPQRTAQAEQNPVEDIVSSETEVNDVQPHSSQSESGSSEASREDASSEQTSQAVPVSLSYTITGLVKMKDNNGLPIADGNVYTKNVLVSLLSEGKEIAQTKTNDAGEYTFKNLKIKQGTYTVKCEYLSNRYGSFLEEEPSIEVLSNNYITVPTIYSSDITAPTVVINSYDEKGLRTKVNMKSVEVIIGDETQTSYKLAVFPIDSQTAIAEGTVDDINSLLAGSLSVGKYILKAVVTDAAGNKTVAQIEFYIV